MTIKSARKSIKSTQNPVQDSGAKPKIDALPKLNKTHGTNKQRVK